MEIDPKLVAAARAAFPAAAKTVTLGAPLHGGACFAEPLVRVPLAMLNRHGLIAGATGTGKTKTLQLMAEQISAAGTPVFLADLKGDLSGLGVAGRERRSRHHTRQGHRLHLEAGRLPDRAREPHRPARRPAARHRLVVRTAPARQGARPERDPDERAGDGLQVLRRPRPLAARLPGSPRRPAASHRRRRRRAQGLRRHVEGERRGAAARDGRARSARGARLLRRARVRARGPPAGRARRPRSRHRPRARRRAGQARALLDLHDVDAGHGSTPRCRRSATSSSRS